MNFKKIALVVLFVAVTVGIAYLMYRLFFGAPAAPTVPTEGEQPTVPGGGGLPSAEEGRPTPGGPTAPTGLPESDLIARGGPTQTKQVAEGTVLSPIVTTSGTLNFYNEFDDKFYRRLDDGKVVAMSERTFPSVDKVEWAPAGDKAVLEFPDDTKIIFDFKSQKQVTLPKHWEDFDFSGDGRSIAAKSMAEDPANRWLITFDSNGQGAQLIEPIGDQGDKVIVDFSPDNTVVAFSDTAEPVGFESKDYLLIGRNGENFKSLRVEGFDFKPLWSPSGTNLLYSASNIGDDFVPTLWFSGAKGADIGSGRTHLEVRTWADKCTFASEETVFCAVPDYLPEGAGLQREIADGIPDSIVKIDLRAGTTQTIGRPAAGATIENLSVTPDGSRLFFTNAATETLEEMRLK